MLKKSEKPRTNKGTVERIHSGQGYRNLGAGQSVVYVIGENDKVKVTTNVVVE